MEGGGGGRRRWRRREGRGTGVGEAILAQVRPERVGPLLIVLH